MILKFNASIAGEEPGTQFDASSVKAAKVIATKLLEAGCIQDQRITLVEVKEDEMGNIYRTDNVYYKERGKWRNNSHGRRDKRSAWMHGK